jgi:phage shock protein PspC (stress-responsive transcriptional regulator)
MYRSFTDRVFAGVCGGLGAVLHINAWWIRAAFVLLALVTTGAFAVLYVILWWMLPQESLVGRRRGGSGRMLLVTLLIVVTAVGWVLSRSGGLTGPTGQDLYWPVLLLLAGLIFFFRQVRA